MSYIYLRQVYTNGFRVERKTMELYKTMNVIENLGPNKIDKIDVHMYVDIANMQTTRWLTNKLRSMGMSVSSLMGKKFLVETLAYAIF